MSVLMVTASSATISVIGLATSPAAQAAVWTDQGDYPPGSVVTFSGGNSDGAGYAAGETVHVDVNGPGAITQSCDATADDSGAWSCQITLGSGVAAIGGYTYTATGQTSAVSQGGTFTDSGCKNDSAIGTPKTDPDVAASFTTSGNTASYSISTPNETPSGGIPGLIEYCVYPGSTAPDTVTATYDSWDGVIPDHYANHGYFDFERSNGDPSNLPFDGSTQTVGTANWSGGVPASQTIVLHINDPDACNAIYGGNPGTCFVLPGSGSQANVDLKVSKTAAAAFTRTYTWGITKNVDKDTQNIADGGSATFNYTVAVTHDDGTDSDWQVTGKITVTNPNSVGFNGINVTDKIDNGGACQVQNGSPGNVDPSNAVIPASGSVDFPYTCTYSSAPSPSSGTDTATATWDKTAYNTPDSSASGQATADFGTANPKIVDDSASVSDTLGGTLGLVSYTDPSPKKFPYSKTFSGDPAGKCTTHDNTATFTTSDTGTTGSAGQSVKVCVGADLTVKKDATPAFTRTYNWKIAKSVDKAFLDPGGTANYTVTANEVGFADSGWQVTGAITVHNPNDWESVTLTGVTDAINNGGTCTVSGDTSQVITAGGDAQLAYACTYGSAPSPASGTNTATATWDKGAASTPDGSASGQAAADFGSATPTATVNKTVTVTDSQAGTLGTATATDTQPFTTKTFTYGKKFTPPASGCATVNNTATIKETGQTASASVKNCNTGALTMGFWQNKNGQGIITGGNSSSGVCNSGTWLRQYAPFQDLSATATCSQVAGYVSNIIKAANASGTSMNPMLKAQMLATALDVYFSDPGLGGNKINAPVPVGGATIDLTNICKMIDSSGGTGSCSGTSENASSAFGGAASMKVSDMLGYAASQSNVGGSTWYANKKATQELAKDAFDAINNQVASSP
ncbi:MAG TPA: hypothetical protein VJS67_02500 [Pseudonocardiaceae bacterium]|nr:hypothetical protein [Pseudonocardiaceae bacterium]